MNSFGPAPGKYFYAARRNWPGIGSRYGEERFGSANMAGVAVQRQSCAAARAKSRMAETEGFEPSIGLYNPITV
jgi:hypothetical protein